MRYIMKSEFGKACLDDQTQESSWPTPEHFIDGDGFLMDEFPSRSLIPFDSILTMRGGIIVAEGGSGKTFLMEGLKRNLRDGTYKYITVAEFVSDIDGFKEELDVTDSAIEYLLIDGLDEGIEITSILARKIKEFQRIKSSLKIVIASRYIEQIKPLNNISKLPIYYLMPLSKGNVSKMASFESVEEEEFFEWIKQVGLSSMCARPIGCNMLLKYFKNKGFENNDCGKLISTEIWQNGIENLCAENDSESRQLVASFAPPYTSNDYFYCASKIAIILKLSGKNEVQAFSSSGECDQLFSHFYNTGRSYDIFNRLLSHSIFMPTGARRYRFSHMTYWDYLAMIGLKKYVDRRHWTTILLSSEREAVYPQWEGIATWLAAVDQEWQKIILKIQPELFLKSFDLLFSIEPTEFLKALINRVNVLGYARRGLSLNLLRNNRFKTEECLDVIRDVFMSPHSDGQIEFAMGLIGSLRLVELTDCLIAYFTDSTKNENLREHAGYELKRFGNEEGFAECKKVLKQPGISFTLGLLAIENSGVSNLTIDDMVPFLNEFDKGKFKNHFSLIEDEFYKMIIDFPEEKIIGLAEWIIDSGVKKEKESEELTALKKIVFRLCWGKHFKPEKLDVIARLYKVFEENKCDPFICSKDYMINASYPYSMDDYWNEKEKRYQILLFILKENIILVNNINKCRLRLLDPSDADFIIRLIFDERIKDRQTDLITNFSYYINCSILPEKSSEWDKLHELCPEHFIYDAKTTINNIRKYNENRNKNSVVEYRKKEEKEYLSSLCRIKKYLRDDTAKKYFYHIIIFFINKQRFFLDMSKNPVWDEFDEEEQKLLIEAARGFLFLNVGQDLDEYSRQSIYPVALYMVYKYAHDDFSKFSDDFWKTYFPVLADECDLNADDGLSFLEDNNDKQEKKEFLRLIEELWKTRKNLFRNILIDFMLNPQNIVFLHRLKNNLQYLDVYDLKNILERMKTQSLTDEHQFGLLSLLYEKYPSSIKDYVSCVFESRSTIGKLDDNKMTVLFLVMLPEQFDGFWAPSEADTPKRLEWLKHILSKGITDDAYVFFLTYQPLNQLTDCYIWLNRSFPNENEPFHVGGYIPDDIDRIYEFKHKIWKSIRDSCDGHASEAISKIRQTFPSEQWMEECSYEVHRHDLSCLCQSYDVESIKEMMDSNSTKNIVNSPQDLLDLVMRALDNYQIFLTGTKNPRVGDLWNSWRNKVLSHKSENAFSNHMASYLEGHLDNTIINREVQLNAGRNGDSGARTDIMIETFLANKTDRISLCIEVKGSWNYEAETALENQLFKRYMRDGGADAGILLVGWFQSKRTKQNGNRWKDDREMARRVLQEQVEALKAQEHCVIASRVIDCDY